MKKLTTGIPILYVKEIVLSNELLRVINEDKDKRLLVLEADTQCKSAGPLITSVMAPGKSRYRVPITVVSGNLTDKPLDALF